MRYLLCRTFRLRMVYCVEQHLKSKREMRLAYHDTQILHRFSYGRFEREQGSIIGAAAHAFLDFQRCGESKSPLAMGELRDGNLVPKRITIQGAQRMPDECDSGAPTAILVQRPNSRRECFRGYKQLRSWRLVLL